MTNAFAGAVVGLTLYTASFVCEALRSGVNAVPVGQAEAARAIGLPFAGVMSNVVLPQAMRAALPPLASTIIALLKNTTVATSVLVLEAAYQLDQLLDKYPTDRWPILLLFAVTFVVMVEVVSFFSSRLERRWSGGPMSQSVLFDAPGPRTIRRHRIYTVLTVLAILGAVAFVVYRLYRRSSSRAASGKCSRPPTTSSSSQGGVLETLKMAAGGIIGAVVLGFAARGRQALRHAAGAGAVLGWSSSSSGRCRCCS